MLTDGRTDIRTDRPSCRDARTHLKTDTLYRRKNPSNSRDAFRLLYVFVVDDANCGTRIRSAWIEFARLRVIRIWVIWPLALTFRFTPYLYAALKWNG